MYASSLSLVGNDLNFKQSLEFAKNISVTKSPVLITGDLGTGKRSLCYFMHANSARKTGAFIVVDCAGELSRVEQEILGYREEGTGKFFKGALERGNGGTVIFANIDCLDENFQKRLYKIIQELPDYELDVRLGATTTKNLAKLVSAGRFQRSLFSFFSCAQISLSTLKERAVDIETLSRHFIAEFSPDIELSITDDAMEKLLNHTWSNNIAELREVMASAAQNHNEGVIDLECLSMGDKKQDLRLADTDEEGFKLMSLRDAEKLLIKKALIYTSENRTQAAKILGVSIRTLRNKINEYRNDGTNYFVNLR
ncbi:MAG: sigma-54-dependent transcriptional regulator [Bacteriovoracaceae bacterium]